MVKKEAKKVAKVKFRQKKQSKYEPFEMFKGDGYGKKKKSIF